MARVVPSLPHPPRVPSLPAHPVVPPSRRIRRATPTRRHAHGTPPRRACCLVPAGGRPPRGRASRSFFCAGGPLWRALPCARCCPVARLPAQAPAATRPLPVGAECPPPATASPYCPCGYTSTPSFHTNLPTGGRSGRVGGRVCEKTNMRPPMSQVGGARAQIGHNPQLRSPSGCGWLQRDCFGLRATGCLRAHGSLSPTVWPRACAAGAGRQGGQQPRCEADRRTKAAELRSPRRCTLEATRRRPPAGRCRFGQLAPLPAAVGGRPRRRQQLVAARGQESSGVAPVFRPARLPFGVRSPAAGQPAPACSAGGNPTLAGSDESRRQSPQARRPTRCQWPGTGTPFGSVRPADENGDRVSLRADGNATAEALGSGMWTATHGTTDGRP